MSEERLKFELAQALTYNFFDGRYYITLDTEADCEQFLTFLQMHDKSLTPSVINHLKTRAKSIIWRYSKCCHHHQVEWMNDTTYFHKQDIDCHPMEYAKIKPYVEKMLFAARLVKPITST